MNSTTAKRLLQATLAMPRASSTTDELKKRLKAGKCISPECKSGLPPRSRGVCARCYHQFREKLQEKDNDDERLQFETECITQGLILGTGEMGRWKSETTNPFARVAAKVG